ncbi:hypothetical protein [Glutamicibacter sp. JC586]|uniref:hypothetical protein n=1 Tax=Glutamicibacter sp. JC586 TaxID=2590552 RepID=UPI00135BA1EF|nr:hypothetical protein [Glutamicibacter sp. JC586]
MTSEQEPTRGRRKRPRVVAPPQHLEQRVQLTGSYTPVPHSESVDRAVAGSQSADGNFPSASAKNSQRSGDPLADLLAKDQDPRSWGDAKEDLAEHMKREKPPHWG